MDQEFSNRVALVTGGSRGIGRACCVRLAQAGASVAINYAKSEKAARETFRLVEEAGVKAHVVRADVSSSEQVDAMVREITDTLGPVDLLVNNAGIFELGTHEETTRDLWERTMAVNLTGPYLVTWAVKDGMIKRGFGRIVNVASIAALRARPWSIAYAVSKAGLVSLTKSLAQSIAKNNVRVNAVAPGLVETEILDGVEEEALTRLVDDTPMPRVGQPHEIVQVVHFLLSEQSSFMTGQTVVASGGRVLLP